MQFEHTIAIDAPPERVWAVSIDVERWPEWTASVRRVQRLEGGPFGLDSRALIQQPGVPAMTWRVTAFEPGRAFTWEAHSPGIRTVGAHLLESEGAGTRATLRVDYHGLLAGLVGRLAAGIVRRYLALEAEGLKRRCEASGLP